VNWLRTRLARRKQCAEHRRLEREIDEELQFHLAMRTEANVAEGMTPDEVRHLYGFMASERRFTTRLIGLFALVALSLVAGGTYGMMSYLVRQRRHGMGVRVALGARSGEVVTFVLKQSLRLAFAGIGLGLVGAVIASGVIESLLLGVGALNPTFMIGSVLFLLVVATIATAVPALRAVRVDPVEVMRAG